MNRFLFVGLIIPVLIIYSPLLSIKHRRWEFAGRVMLAIGVLWFFLLVSSIYITEIVCSDCEARGDIDGAMADTGLNAITLMLGWIPSVIYCVFLALIYVLLFWIYKKYKTEIISKVNLINNKSIRIFINITVLFLIGFLSTSVFYAFKWDTVSKRGWQPIHYAIYEDNNTSFQEIIDTITEVNIKTAKGDTPLLIASTYDRTDMVRLLLENGAKPDKKCLWAAIRNGNENIARQLIDNGVDVHNLDDWEEGKYSVLHAAAVCGYTNIAKLAIEKGCDINAKNSIGQTPLLLASALGKTEVVELLIKCGADVNEPWDLETPLSNAKERGHRDVVKLLKEAGAK